MKEGNIQLALKSWLTPSHDGFTNSYTFIVRPSSSLPATEIEAPFLLSFVDAGSDLARRRRLRPSPLMPRFKSASLSIAAAVPLISAATAAPFISDATAALFVSTITATVSNRLGSSVLLKSTVSYAVRLSGDSRKAMSSGSVTQGSVFINPRRKPPPLPSKPFPFHYSIGAAKTCAIDETCHCGEVLKLSPTCPARCADCSGSPPDAPPFSIVGRLDTAGDFPQPHTTVRKHSSEMDMVSLILAKSQRISGGFIGPFELRIMIYLLVMKSFPLDSSGTSWLLVLPSSHKEWISYLLSMKGYTFSVLLLSSGFSFSTVRPSSSLPTTEIEAPFFLSFVDAGSDLARRRRLRLSFLVPRFKSASLSIAAAVPLIFAATAAPFVSDATAALFVSTITAIVSNRLGSSVFLKSTVSYAVRLSGDSRKAMSSGSSAPRIPCRCSSVLRVPWCCGSYSWCVRSVTQGSVFVDPHRKPPPLSSKPFPFHYSTGAAKTCAIDETRHCGEVLKLSPTCPARCADCSGSQPDAPPLTTITADIISSRLSSVMKSFPLDSSGTSWLLVLPSSHKEWISYLLSMKGYTFSVLLLSSGFSFSTGMSSCVAVSTGPEEATKITFGFLINAGNYNELCKLANGEFRHMFI
ncbi:hypothetical protein F2Q69_00033447 [Brassica cretica]|uniref:Uncharacterized protein n=1 Tax=Brassica cretica TaxID=69181 RepID=A0A8S9SCX4_BRACR|nr:hypothetical protein F2Q69_00033447 [Brassica cretica]